MAKHTLHVLELKKRIDNESKKIIRELHIK